MKDHPSKTLVMDVLFIYYTSEVCVKDGVSDWNDSFLYDSFFPKVENK